MKFKKHLLKIGIIASTLIITSSFAAGLGINFLKKNTDLNFSNNKDKYIFKGIEFNTMNDALNFANSMIEKEKIDASNKNLWSANIGNESFLFNTPEDLNLFLNNQIKVFSTSTDIINHSLNPVDNSLLVSDLWKYNFDTNNMEVHEPQLVNIYESINDTYKYANYDDYEQNYNQMNNAKDSYLQIHRAYYFNGIYFKTKQDLEIYLKKHYYKEAIGTAEDTSYYRKIISPKNNTIRTNPINFKQIINGDIDDLHKINLEVAEFLEPNSYQYLKLVKNGKNNYIKMVENSLEYEDVQDIKVEDLPIINLKSNQNKSLYVVDASYEEEYNFIGPYFLETDSLIENITNKSLWKKSNDKPEQIIQSQAIEIFSAFLDLFLLKPGQNWSNKKFGISEDENGFYLDENNVLFDISNYDKTGRLKQLEINMYKELMKVKYDVHNTLYDKFISMAQSLVKTKTYNSFYAIPLFYSYLIESVVDSFAPLSAYLAIEKYFTEICNVFDDILMKLFGKDILTKYDALYSGNAEKENDIFKFSKFYGIGQYGFDYNALGTLLSGNSFIRNYKQLFIASYVYLQAILNSQNNMKIKIDVRDELILKVIAEGSNSDQNSIANIKQKFEMKKNGTSIFEKLEIIYNSVSKMSEIIENDVKERVFHEKLPYTSDNFKILENKINEYDNFEIPSGFSETIKKMSNELNNGSSIQNKTSDSVTNTIIENSFKYKTTSKYKASLKLCYDMENSIKYNEFVGKFSSLNDLEDSKKILLMQKMKEEFELELNVEQETTYEYITKTKIIHEMSDEHNTFKNKGINKIKSSLDNLISGIQLGVNLTNSIIKIVSDVNNSFYPNDVKAELIAKSTLNLLSSLCDFVGNFVPAPFGAIIKGVAGVFSLVSGILGEAKQQIYEFSIKENNGQTIKYYWDGGLMMSRLFGLITETKRGIDSLKILSPIKITNQRMSDVIYFDKLIYSEADLPLVKKLALKKILNENIDGYNVSKVYSLNPDLSNEYVELDESTTFDDLYDTDINNPNTLSRYVIDRIVESITDGRPFEFADDIDGELFFNGYKFNSIEEYEATMENRIINEIKPVYISQIPKLNPYNKPLDSKEQLPFRLPLPYFEPTNDENDQIVSYSNESDLSNNREYIIVNSNQKINNSYQTETKIIKDITEMFRETINVNSKTALKHSTLLNKNYSNFDNGVYDINLYTIKINEIDLKVFLNKDDAINYLIKQLNLNNNSFLLETNEYEILTIDDENGNTIYFNTYNEFLKWFYQNINQTSGV